RSCFDLSEMERLVLPVYDSNNIKQTVFHNRDIPIGTLHVFIGGNLSEERFSPEPPSKDF
ncbi:MAG: hypothetical protein IJY29_02865, partial [Ruminococcus sp.]|nr:hypothetical protein [Ruminococcus sp.]